MPHYQSRGRLPRKRHTAFRKADGGLHAEHLMGGLGFSGPASLLYHLRPPTRVLSTRKPRDVTPEADGERALKMRHFRLGGLPAAGRTPVLFNADVTMSVGRPAGDFYRNGQADEVVYVSHGEGVLATEFGELAYRPGDYVVIPRGVTQQFQPAGGESRFLIIETPSRVRFPSRYMTNEGQLMEHAPFCERDIRPPAELITHDRIGEFTIAVKQSDAVTELTVDHHPFDVVGWDGCYYPFALSIHDFEPITGSLHQPPPVHQTFQADGFVVCSFVPRLFDFHPDAVPAPYNHSNVNSDEVLYYANDEFMSRKGIAYGSLTLHPAGLPHGPHPGRAEASIGKKETKELAVMLDTFRPLRVAAAAAAVEDTDYARSWLE